MIINEELEIYLVWWKSSRNCLSVGELLPIDVNKGRC